MRPRSESLQRRKKEVRQIEVRVEFTEKKEGSETDRGEGRVYREERRK